MQTTTFISIKDVCNTDAPIVQFILLWQLTRLVVCSLHWQAYYTMYRDFFLWAQIWLRQHVCFDGIFFNYMFTTTIKWTQVWNMCSNCMILKPFCNNFSSLLCFAECFHQPWRVRHTVKFHLKLGSQFPGTRYECDTGDEAIIYSKYVIM